MKKQWVIPDIHGHIKTLEVLVEQQIRPSKHDELYFLGDYIDRGPDSKAVIDYLINLQKDDYYVRFLLGNHEDYCIKAYIKCQSAKSFLGLKSRNHIKKEWERYGAKETLRSFGVKNMKEFPERYIDWMKGLEYYIELDEYILVHAGFNFKIDNPLSDKHAMIWVRDYKVIPEKINHKTIIHGHVPVSLEFLDMTIKNKSYHFISLDNGVYMDVSQGFGNLTAFEVNSKELIIQPNMDY